MMVDQQLEKRKKDYQSGPVWCWPRILQWLN